MKLVYPEPDSQEPIRQELDCESIIDPDGIRSIDRPLSEIDEPKLQQLFDHWDRARAGRPWLVRSDFRPELCPSVLPHLALIEHRHGETPSLHIRLTGGEIENPNFGFAKGRFVEHVTPPWYREHLMAAYLAAFQDGQMHYHLVRAIYQYRVILYRRLMLPVTADGAAVDMLLVTSIRTRRLADFIAAGRELA